MPVNGSEKPPGLESRFCWLSLLANGLVCFRDMFSDKPQAARDSETDAFPNTPPTPLRRCEDTFNLIADTCLTRRSTWLSQSASAATVCQSLSPIWEVFPCNSQVAFRFPLAASKTRPRDPLHRFRWTPIRWG
jgi:hypothetical protein